jgi:hypothetical protein
VARDSHRLNYLDGVETENCVFCHHIRDIDCPYLLSRNRQDNAVCWGKELYSAKQAAPNRREEISIETRSRCSLASLYKGLGGSTPMQEARTSQSAHGDRLCFCRDNDMPFGWPALGGQPPSECIWCFQELLLVMLFLHMVCLTVALATPVS